MARRFPHASVLGVDIYPPSVDPKTSPSNLQFDICDVNVEMSRFYDQFDVIHSRGVGGGIRNIDRTIIEFQKCLKPGGILFIIDGDRVLYENRDQPVKMKKLPGDPDVSGVSEDGSWTRRMIAGELITFMAFNLLRLILTPCARRGLGKISIRRCPCGSLL
jgi:SAM-dependent methyltransferase